MSSAVYYSNAPRCLVTFDDLLANTARLTIYRTSDGRTEEVRGGVDLTPAAPFVMDYEVAVGVQSAYRALCYAADGTELGYTGQVTADVAASEGTWLQQPLAPETAVRVRVHLESGASMTKPTPGDIEWPEGAYVGRMIGGQRRGIVGMNVRVMVPFADLATVDGMLGGYGTDYPSVLLLRTPPPLRWPRLFYMGVPSPEETRAGLYALNGFSLDATEVAPPFPGLVRPLLRRKDIDAAFSTRSARAGAYATRLARDTDYTKAGLAR